MSWRRSFFRNSMWLALGLLLGRLAGFGRESMLAGAFGAGEKADVAILVLIIPDMMTNLLVGGGLSLVLIPEFRRHMGQDKAGDLFLQSSIAIGLLFLSVVAFLIYFVDSFSQWVAPGFSADQLDLLAALFVISLWAVPLTALAGTSRSYLQASNRFVMASMGTLIYNFAIIASLIWIISIKNSLLPLAIGVIVGALCRLLLQLWRLPNINWRFSVFSEILIGWPLIRRYILAVASAGILVLLPVTAIVIASLSAPGSVAQLNYANKLVQLPLGMFVTVFAIAVFPHLTDCLQNKEKIGGGCHDIICETFRIVLVISLAAVIPMILFSHDIVDLVFGWGKMPQSKITDIAGLVAVGLLSVPFQGLSSVLINLFAAKDDTLAPFLIHLIAFIVFVVMGERIMHANGLQGLVLLMVGVYISIVVFQVAILKLRHGLGVLGDIINLDFIKIFFSMALIGLLFLIILQAVDVSIASSIFAAALLGLLLLVIPVVVSRSYRAQLIQMIR